MFITSVEEGECHRQRGTVYLATASGPRRNRSPRLDGGAPQAFDRVNRIPSLHRCAVVRLRRRLSGLVNVWRCLHVGHPPRSYRFLGSTSEVTAAMFVASFGSQDGRQRITRAVLSVGVLWYAGMPGCRSAGIRGTMCARPHQSTARGTVRTAELGHAPFGYAPLGGAAWRVGRARPFLGPPDRVYAGRPAVVRRMADEAGQRAPHQTIQRYLRMPIVQYMMQRDHGRSGLPRACCSGSLYRSVPPRPGRGGTLHQVDAPGSGAGSFPVVSRTVLSREGAGADGRPDADPELVIAGFDADPGVVSVGSDARTEYQRDGATTVPDVGTPRRRSTGFRSSEPRERWQAAWLLSGGVMVSMRLGTQSSIESGVLFHVKRHAIEKILTVRRRGPLRCGLDGGNGCPGYSRCQPERELRSNASESGVSRSGLPSSHWAQEVPNSVESGRQLSKKPVRCLGPGAPVR